MAVIPVQVLRVGYCLLGSLRSVTERSGNRPLGQQFKLPIMQLVQQDRCPTG